MSRFFRFIAILLMVSIVCFSNASVANALQISPRDRICFATLDTLSKGSIYQEEIQKISSNKKIKVTSTHSPRLDTYLKLGDIYRDKGMYERAKGYYKMEIRKIQEAKALDALIYSMIELDRLELPSIEQRKDLNQSILDAADKINNVLNSNTFFPSISMSGCGSCSDSPVGLYGKFCGTCNEDMPPID